MSIAAEVAKAGVTVNVVSPGAIDTPLLSGSHRENWDKVSRYLARSIPVGRIGTPAETAAAVGFPSTGRHRTSPGRHSRSAAE